MTSVTTKGTAAFEPDDSDVVEGHRPGAKNWTYQWLDHFLFTDFFWTQVSEPA